MLFYKTKQDFIEGQWYQASTVGRDEPGGGRILARRSEDRQTQSGSSKW